MIFDKVNKLSRVALQLFQISFKQLQKEVIHWHLFNWVKTVHTKSPCQSGSQNFSGKRKVDN